jgi:hypothetical protein
MQKSTPAFVTSLLATIALTTTASSRDLAADEGPGFIEGASYEGDGCPSGSATTDLSEDRQAVTSRYPDLSALAGPDLPDELESTTCTSTYQINVPPGWSYTVMPAVQRGYIALEQDGTARREATYRISGSSSEKTASSSWTGPVDGSFDPSDIDPGSPIDWSPCGGGQTFQIVTTLEVDLAGHPERLAEVGVRSIDLQLAWRQCQ